MKLKTENRVLRETLKSRQGFGNIVGRAPEMEKLYRIIAKASQSNASRPDSWGERHRQGTGSEISALHRPNRTKPFIPVDCGSLVPTLIESELFAMCGAPSRARLIRKTACWRSRKGAPFSWMR